MAERRAEQNSLAACPVLPACPWQVLSAGPSAQQVYHVPHRAYNSCDGIRADLQSRSTATVLADGNATLFSQEWLAAVCMEKNKDFKNASSSRESEQ